MPPIAPPQRCAAPVLPVRPASPSAGGSRFSRLSALAPVGLDAAACLHLQKPWVGCSSCRDACPADCLSLEDGHLALAATACLHCGQCAAACPTQALSVEGFALATPPAPELTLACPRQPAPEGFALLVPCLGGLHVNDLLAALLKHPQQRLVLADDGRCGDCPSGARNPAPARRLNETIAPVLRSSSVSTDRVAVRRIPSSLPDGNRPIPAGKPTRAETPAASRRAFFSGLGRAVSDGVVRKAGRVSALFDAARVDRAPRQPIVSARTQDTWLLMQRLAAPSGDLPTGFPAPEVFVAASCRLHGACTRVCPTAALAVAECGANDESRRELHFDVARCIACGACRDACPDAALHYEAPAWRAFRAGSSVLARQDLVECSRCGDLTTTPGEDGFCPTCGKAMALSRAGFALFGRGATARPTETGPP